MLEILEHLRTTSMVVGTDAKMKNLTQGWSIISVGIALQEASRSTTFARLGPDARKIQGSGVACSFHPVVQAVVHTESQYTF